MSIVTPAVLPSSREDLEGKLALLGHIPAVRRIQIDVVDGKFASPASWPYSAPTDLRAMLDEGVMLPYLDRIEYEIDLMCLATEEAALTWLTLGASRLTFHAESTTNLPYFLQCAGTRYGRECLSFGLALNIESDIALIESSLTHIDYVQFMGIAQIGRQGQPFDPRVFKKIEQFHKRHPEIPLQVDGGVSLAMAPRLLSIGVSTLIVGSAILRAADPEAAVATFESLQTSFGV
jgi:pentose-5-phosphate-3-epimerase